MLLFGIQILLPFLNMYVFVMSRFLFGFKTRPGLAVLSSGTTATLTQHTLLSKVSYAQHILPSDTVSLFFKKEKQ